MTVAQALLVGAAVLLGAATQRTAGLGFALVAAPFLVLLTGPVTGVLMSNALGGLMCAVVLLRTRRGARWRSVALLAVPALVAVPVGALVVRRLPDGPLLVVVGAMSMAAVLLAVVGRKRVLLRGRGAAVAAGALSGFMNATAGVGGPMLSAYGIAQHWPREVFIPTVQACLLLVNVASLVSKGMPRIDATTWAVGLGALAAGAVLGEWLSARVRPGAGQRFIFVAALAGGAAAVVRGLLVL